MRYPKSAVVAQIANRIARYGADGYTTFGQSCVTDKQLKEAERLGRLKANHLRGKKRRHAKEQRIR